MVIFERARSGRRTDATRTTNESLSTRFRAAASNDATLAAAAATAAAAAIGLISNFNQSQ